MNVWANDSECDWQWQGPDDPNVASLCTNSTKLSKHALCTSGTTFKGILIEEIEFLCCCCNNINPFACLCYTSIFAIFNQISILLFNEMDSGKNLKPQIPVFIYGPISPFSHHRVNRWPGSFESVNSANCRETQVQGNLFW